MIPRPRSLLPQSRSKRCRANTLEAAGKQGIYSAPFLCTSLRCDNSIVCICLQRYILLFPGSKQKTSLLWVSKLASFAKKIGRHFGWSALGGLARLGAARRGRGANEIAPNSPRYWSCWFSYKLSLCDLSLQKWKLGQWVSHRFASPQRKCVCVSPFVINLGWHCQTISPRCSFLIKRDFSTSVNSGLAFNKLLAKSAARIYPHWTFCDSCTVIFWGSIFNLLV